MAFYVQSLIIAVWLWCVRWQVYAATTDHSLHAYHLKGRRDFSLKLPALATQLEVLKTR